MGQQRVNRLREGLYVRLLFKGVKQRLHSGSRFSIHRLIATAQVDHRQAGTNIVQHLVQQLTCGWPALR